ncbi:MAG: hypothetical protein AAGA30_09020 [Planctomycetota bacterium]
MATTNSRSTLPLTGYFSVLAMTIVSYLAYSFFVVPYIEVESIARRNTQIDDSEYEYLGQEVEHRRWFSEDDWETKPCAVLKTAHGKILFDDYKVEDPTTWLVYPFSMVLDRQQPSDPAATPLPPNILRCEKGAHLKFSQPISSLGGANFELRSARLEGNVELYRLPSVAGKEDGLRIETSNIQINDDQIITMDDVVFWFGRHQGIGRNLSMQLSHESQTSRIAADFSKIDGLKNLKLGHLSSMTLRPGDSHPSNKSQLLNNDKAPVEITSNGFFEFDFANQITDGFGSAIKACWSARQIFSSQ